MYKASLRVFEMKTFFRVDNGFRKMQFVYLIFAICFFIVSPQRGRVRGQSENESTRASRRDNRDIVDGIDINQSQLNSARAKFNAINNQNYNYQFQKSCFCPICDIQSMNVIVEDNEVTSCDYAEGDDYALSNFCFNNQDLFDQRRTDAEITIDDIFDMIQTSIDNGDNVGVLYHDDIGIPLSISIDPSDEDINGLATDEQQSQFIAINCLEFDVNFPSPAATTRRGGRRNRRNSVLTTTIQEFNNDDPYSCGNIQGMLITVQISS